MANRRYDRYYDAEDRASYFGRDDYPDDLDRSRYRSLDRPYAEPDAAYSTRWREERDRFYDEMPRVPREDDRRSSGARYDRPYTSREEYERYGRGDDERFLSRGEGGRYGRRDEGGRDTWLRESREEREARGPFVGRGPKNYRRADARIYEEVCDRLTWHGDIDPSDVEVQVENGEVTLNGTVESRQARRLAEDIADSVPGVSDVHNRLRVESRERAGETAGERTAAIANVGTTATDMPPTAGRPPARVAATGERAGTDEKKNHVVTAIFRTRQAAETAVNRLVESGYDRSDVSIMMSRETGGREFGFSESSKAPEGAATGAAVGGVLGAIAAGLAAVGTIALPGIGLVAAGPILAALAGAGAGGAAGSLIGGLVGAGIPEHEAKLYSEEIQRGAILVAVQTTDDRSGTVKDILRHNGGESITSR